jgi:hypothetical protein
MHGARTTCAVRQRLACIRFDILQIGSPDAVIEVDDYVIIRDEFVRRPDRFEDNRVRVADRGDEQREDGLALDHTPHASGSGSDLSRGDPPAQTSARLSEERTIAVTLDESGTRPAFTPTS